MVVSKEAEEVWHQTGSPVRAAEYVRKSTDHQKYSTENQAEVIRKYAEARGYTIVHSYADSGKSGLRLDGREALQSLLDDVQAGRADYSALLVYDVSRWGRFQDADESAFYEYVCKRAGVAVHFCAEQFENDGSLAATMIKGMKRVMAGEYSRELSVKVFMGQCRLIEMGFRQGGIAGYGLRRLLVDEHRNPKSELTRGQQKSIHTDRVVLVPGPKEEVETVQRIYAMFLQETRTEAAIAAILNEEGVPTGWGHPWTRAVVRGILTNEKYIGSNIFNRRSFKLKQRRVANSPSMWIKAEGAFVPLIDHETFGDVRLVVDARRHRWSDDEMLTALSVLLRERGCLSALVIDETEGMPSSGAYRQRFGSLIRAYRLIGASPLRDDAYVEINRTLRTMHPEVVARTISEIERTGGVVERGCDGRLTINGEMSLNLVIARCALMPGGSFRWTVRFDPGGRPDLTVAVRMEQDNVAIKDYYLLPRIDMTLTKVQLKEENGVFLDAFRFDNLDYLLDMTARVPFRSAA